MQMLCKIMLLKLVLSCFVFQICVGFDFGKPHKDQYSKGGKPARIEDFQYVAAIMRSNSFVGTGSAISPMWVLSAASTLAGIPQSQMTVRAGSANRQSGGVVVKIFRIVQHPTFDIFTMNNDVSLVQVTPNLEGPNVAIIPLVFANADFPPNTKGYSVGWGKPTYELNIGTLLEKINLKISDWDYCNGILRIFRGLTSTMFCAGQKNMMDGCQGNSGAPIVIGGRLYGLVSWGSICAAPTWPGVFSKISAPSIRSFIKKTTGI